MKLAIPAIGVLASVLILASVGVLYSNSYEKGSGFSLAESSMPLGTAYMTTNVKVTQFDEDGNTIALRQGTNHITKTGMSIIMGQIFGGYDEVSTQPGGINGSYARLQDFGDFTNNVTGRIGWMEIGTGGDDVWPDRLKYNNTDLANPVRGACIRVPILVSNATQGSAHGWPSSCVNPANDPVAGVGSARLCSAQMNVTATAQFQGANCNTLSIDEAGIFTASTPECNGGSCGLMFARNIFGSVDLGLLDTLQLEWEFTFTDS